MSHNDPTDHALAAIASIFEKPEAKPAEGEPAQAHDAEFGLADRPDPGAAKAREIEQDVDGYSRSGPGPLDALRFRWTARRDDDGNYYVDETIGYGSRPISTGPMRQDEVVAYIEQRQHDAQRKFDQLREDMAAGSRGTARPQHGDHDRDRNEADEESARERQADEF